MPNRDGPLRHAWEDLYSAAIHEIDSSKLLEAIDCAHHAINNRLQEINRKGSLDERAALSDARFLLEALRKQSYVRPEPTRTLVNALKSTE